MFEIPGSILFIPGASMPVRYGESSGITSMCVLVTPTNIALIPYNVQSGQGRTITTLTFKMHGEHPKKFLMKKLEAGTPPNELMDQVSAWMDQVGLDKTIYWLTRAELRDTRVRAFFLGGSFHWRSPKDDVLEALAFGPKRAKGFKRFWLATGGR